MCTCKCIQVSIDITALDWSKKQALNHKERLGERDIQLEHTNKHYSDMNAHKHNFVGAADTGTS